MSWPTLQDYNEAIQNPRSAFSDPDLRLGQPELNQLGLPRPIAGNFACVYKIQIGGQRWAARCFSSEVSDQQRRYEAISTYLKKVSLPYTVQFSFLPGGIKVLGRNYPLLKMEWVQGEALHSFVGKSIGYPDTLLSLAKVWSIMMGDLKAVSMAHGDLQHGNVVVVGDQLRLIDYDGMYVPGLAGNLSNECGHRNYQLPTRTGFDYGPYLDNFSAWVIYVSLVSLAVHPELWSKYRGGDECLIFRKEDYLQPENSEILRDLNSSPNTELRFLIDVFTSLFSLSPQDVPALDGNLQTPTIERQIVQPSGSNWWSDHAERLPSSEESPTATKPPQETESSIPDPGWILDSLMEEKPVEPLKFQSQTKEIRLIIFGSMALVALTRFFVEMTVSDLLVIVTGVFGLNLLVCFIRYKRDPSQAEFENFKKQSQVFLNQVREHQAIVDALSAERLTVQTKLAENERAIAAQKSRLVTALQTDLNSAQLELNSQLQDIAQRRRDISTSETNKLNSLQSSLGKQISDNDRRIGNLSQKEADEKLLALTSLENTHIERFLKSCSIKSSSISGIGNTYKNRLIQKGFFSAADINWTVRNVPGIGRTRETALLAWKNSMEYLARQYTPVLSTSDRLAIETKYHNERQSLTAEKARLQSQLNTQVASAREFFSNARQSLNMEEQQIRTVSTQEKIKIQQLHDVEIITLTKQADTARNQAAPIISKLSEELRAAQKQTFALRWQSAKREKEGRRFAALRFPNYLRNILS